ncbi:uncharacterized protein MKK02DRAFT_37906 [Dioszegia hungarica]|uniref:Thioesterase domain-containing protein n=1 Tax=Dioszegia hungarica TaxID=4972 RepID=A0AA38H5E6_9TREE|nr:uncharacterized protein MKK02DRAFT_37906 [Dioszegia hungarica]KAI9634375.1 hypothetical protein MKK02DRAFT_37906 [Dioszegia hungarica]
MILLASPPSEFGGTVGFDFTASSRTPLGLGKPRYPVDVLSALVSSLCASPNQRAMKPTEEHEAAWQAFAQVMRFNSSAVKYLQISELDEFPVADKRGRKMIDGWKINWEGKIPPEWDNGNGSMHGAQSAWLVDVCTSAAILLHTTDEFWGPPLRAGVSLNINMTYYHPAIIGTDILVEVEVLKCSATTANLSCNILEKGTRKLLASGTHLKAWRPINRSKM